MGREYSRRPDALSPLPLARILSKAGKDEAQQAWQGLIEQNSDCWDYYKGYLASRGIDLGRVSDLQGMMMSLTLETEAVTDENRDQALQYLHDFSQTFPKAAAPQRIALEVAQGTQYSPSCDRVDSSLQSL